MSRGAVPVDMTNPGQVFACVGLTEAADILLGQAQGAFDWFGPDGVKFQLSAAGDEDPVRRVLRFLDQARVVAVAPPNSRNSTFKWKVDTVTSGSSEFPFPDPDSPATLPAKLEDDEGYSINIDHWGDATRGRDNVKFWAGAGGYPGAALAQDALNLVRGRISEWVDDPFSMHALQSSSFRFDWRRDYVPIDAGFSPNFHPRTITMQGYPLVELLAAIGLTNARPFRDAKLMYRYGVIGTAGTDLHDLIFLRAALGALHSPVPGVPFRRFQIQLDWPGQENQARCITSVLEENVFS